ncbi:MAG: DUF429 domain-containing protein [Gammaproteobacteria bacterium]|nr:DUF429 domain-containing protein [Gammaproteobacteria bacterium]
MPFVLGIDAAWTEGEPSGVALAQIDGTHSRVLCVAPSYEQFVQAGDGIRVDWGARQLRGSEPDIARLLSAARRLGAGIVDLIALDIPLAKTPITSRRASDKAVSKAYGSKGCSTHSPSATRPGPVSEALGRQLKDAGYMLETLPPTPLHSFRAIEVYPHPALLTLLGRDFRIPYKVANSTRYWKGAPIQLRLERLVGELRSIYHPLESKLGALPFVLPTVSEIAGPSQLKRYEDALDALVCAWIGIEHLNGKTTAYGDANSVIWIP